MATRVSDKSYSYHYAYGAGSTPNRKIEFSIVESAVLAKISGRMQGNWKCITELDESKMTVEGASTTEKVRLMAAAREAGHAAIFPNDVPFPKLSLDTKIRMLEQLEPEGKWRIEISNTIGSNPNFEVPDNLFFFDPT